MADEPDANRLMDEVFEMGDDDRNTGPGYDDTGYDLGDDDQSEDIREYERYINDPPDDLVIRDYENDDTGSLGISRELQQEQTRRTRRLEELADDDRSAEAAAVEVHDEGES